MFKINPDATFKAKVNLTIPGREEPAVIDIEFRHKGRAAFAAWWESIEGKNDVDILSGIIASWSGPLDDEGKPLTYSESALTQMIDHYPASAGELIRAYRKELFESRAKN